MKKLLTIQEVAGALQLSVQTIYHKTSRKTIPFLRLGSRVRFDSDAIEQWVKKHEVKKPVTPKFPGVDF